MEPVMSASYVTLCAELPDLEAVYPVIEAESQSRRQSMLLEFISEQYDFDYEDELTLEDIAIEGDRLIVEYQCSTDLCNEVTHALFEGLAETGASGLLAIEYNTRVGMYSCLAPGYDEAECVDDCFDDFDGLMQELEDFMDRREQLLKVIEMTETEPLRSTLRKYMHGDEEDEQESFDELEDDEEEIDESGESLPDGDERESLMDELKRAMAEGDEDRVNELFEQVQKTSQAD
jgi:hypothetical protein